MYRKLLIIQCHTETPTVQKLSDEIFVRNKTLMGMRDGVRWPCTKLLSTFFQQQYFLKCFPLLYLSNLPTLTFLVIKEQPIIHFICVQLSLILWKDNETSSYQYLRQSFIASFLKLRRKNRSLSRSQEPQWACNPQSRPPCRLYCVGKLKVTSNYRLP